MTDFITAFKDGLSAAEAAGRARQEIDDVFSSLNEQINKESDGNLTIIRQKCEAKRVSLLESLAVLSTRPKDMYWAIVASNPKIGQSPVKQLAKWQMDRKGYPCRLSWAESEIVCEDRVALERCLSELLRDPIVGEALNTLMNLKPKECGAETAQPENGQSGKSGNALPGD